LNHRKKINAKHIRLIPSKACRRPGAINRQQRLFNNEPPDASLRQRCWIWELTDVKRTLHGGSQRFRSERKAVAAFVGVTYNLRSQSVAT